MHRGINSYYFCFQDIKYQINDLETPIEQTCKQADKILPSTSTSGRDLIKRESAQLKTDWSELLGQADETKTSLDQALLQWQEWEDSLDTTTRWIDKTEQQIKDIALASTLEDKQETLNKIKVGFSKAKYYKLNFYNSLDLLHETFSSLMIFFFFSY